MKISVRRIVLCVVALASIVLGIICFTLDTGLYAQMKEYGGDAYTGIQNAACKTAWNVKDLANVVKFGFGSVLLIAGATIGATAVLPDKELHIERKPKPAPAAAPGFPQYSSAAWQNPQPSVPQPSVPQPPVQQSADPAPQPAPAAPSYTPPAPPTA